MGCPKAIAPPLMLSFSWGIDNFRCTANVCAANASFTSNTSISDRSMLAFFNKSLIYGLFFKIDVNNWFLLSYINLIILSKVSVDLYL